jgi:hypothetical protein
MESAKNALNAATEKTRETLAGQKQESEQNKAQDSSRGVGERLSAATEAGKEAGSKYMNKAEGEIDEQRLKS